MKFNLYHFVMSEGRKADIRGVWRTFFSNYSVKLKQYFIYFSDAIILVSLVTLVEPPPPHKSWLYPEYVQKSICTHYFVPPPIIWFIFSFTNISLLMLIVKPININRNYKEVK